MFILSLRKKNTMETLDWLGDRRPEYGTVHNQKRKNRRSGQTVDVLFAKPMQRKAIFGFEALDDHILLRQNHDWIPKLEFEKRPPENSQP